jgi:hypothetical protein
MLVWLSPMTLPRAIVAKNVLGGTPRGMRASSESGLMSSGQEMSWNDAAEPPLAHQS